MRVQNAFCLSLLSLSVHLVTFGNLRALILKKDRRDGLILWFSVGGNFVPPRGLLATSGDIFDHKKLGDGSLLTTEAVLLNILQDSPHHK